MSLFPSYERLANLLSHVDIVPSITRDDEMLSVINSDQEQKPPCVMTSRIEPCLDKCHVWSPLDHDTAVLE